MANSIFVIQDRSEQGYKVIEGVSDADALKICAGFDSAASARLEATNARIAAIHKEIIGDPDLTAEYFQYSQAAASADELLTRDLCDRSLEEVEKRVEQYHRYLGNGSAFIFEHKGYRGSARFLTVTWPNFKWAPVCFNDKASSAVAWGGNILFEHTWYRGRRLYMLGVFRAPDFEAFGFNDIASSYVGF